MRLPRPKVERKIQTREVLGMESKAAKPFDLDREFDLFKASLQIDLENWKAWPTAPQEYWASLGEVRVFFPDWRDLSQDLDYSRVYQEFVRRAKQSTEGTQAVFHLMQLFPDKRQDLLSETGIDPNEMPFKGHKGELFLINELLVLAAAHPERLHSYKARAAEELGAVKEWIKESFEFENQIKITLQLAANFLLLCPEYKVEMQELFQPQLQKALDVRRVIEAGSRFQILCNLEVIYGKDEFVINQQGDLIREAGKTQLGERKALPGRLVA